MKNFEKAKHILREHNARLLREESVANGDLLQWWQLGNGQVAILQVYFNGTGVDLFTDHCGGTWGGFEIEVNRNSLPVS